MTLVIFDPKYHPHSLSVIIVHMIISFICLLFWIESCYMKQIQHSRDILLSGFTYSNISSVAKQSAKMVINWDMNSWGQPGVSTSDFEGVHKLCFMNNLNCPSNWVVLPNLQRIAIFKKKLGLYSNVKTNSMISSVYESKDKNIFSLNDSRSNWQRLKVSLLVIQINFLGGL